MSFIIYDFEHTINSFFADTSPLCSKAECDTFAREHYGGSVKPVDIQGSCSYTVIAGPNADKVVQFRKADSSNNLRPMIVAKRIHGSVVAACSELGRLGEKCGSQLQAYGMEKLPGENYIMIRNSLTGLQRLKTVESLASFFAESWLNGSAALHGASVDRSAIASDYRAKFEIMSSTLPDRFQPALEEAQEALPAFFESQQHPIVLTHNDLNETNILVDPATGAVTGICDWSDATFQPFGFALYGLENALGSMGSNGWTWFEDAHELRGRFWATFKQKTGLCEDQLRLIKLAGRAGIFIRYVRVHASGFTGTVGVRDPDADDFRYLDALVLQDG